MSSYEKQAWHSVAQVVARLEHRWTPPIPAVITEYPYIPFPMDRFATGLRMMQHTLATQGVRRLVPRFLDVGCGIGTKVLMAAHMGWRADGLERRPEYAQAARDLLGTPTTDGFDAPRVWETDAFDFDRYHVYDGIFMYRPLVEQDDCKRLTARIVDAMRKDTVLFLAMMPDPDDRCEIVESDTMKLDRVWIKTQR